MRERWIVSLEFERDRRIYATRRGVSPHRRDARRFPTLEAAQAEVDSMPPDLRKTARITPDEEPASMVEMERRMNPATPEIIRRAAEMVEQMIDDPGDDD